MMVVMLLAEANTQVTNIPMMDPQYVPEENIRDISTLMMVVMLPQDGKAVNEKYKSLFKLNQSQWSSL